MSDFDLMLSEFEGDFDFLENSDAVSATPRMQLIHAISELAQEGAAKPGQIVHGLSGEHLCDPGGGFPVIPLYHWPSRVMFPPREMGSNPVCRSLDGKTGVGLPGGDCSTCERKDWVDNKPSQCIAGNDVAFYCPELEGEETSKVLIASFQKSSFKAGSALLTRINGLEHKRFPMAYVFQLGTRQGENAGNKYWTFEFKKWEETNRLEQTIEKFAGKKKFKDIFARCRELAIGIRDDRAELLKGMNPAVGQIETDSDPDKVPF